MMHIKKASDLFRNGFNCSQSVFAAFAKDYGLDEAQALKLACGLGGGMGCTARTCGAVTGALLVLGLKYGSSRAEDKDSKPLTYRKVRDFIEEFEKRRASIECRRLIGTDISFPEGSRKQRKRSFSKLSVPK